MRPGRAILFVVWSAALCVWGAPLRAAVFVEDFTADPMTRGWSRHGEAALFHWNATNQFLEVTWDSSKTNSYFLHPLGTVLAKDDDFTVAFDVRLSDIAIGTTSNKPGTFEIALGLIQLRSATNTNMFRGAGQNLTYGPKNLVEFNYFPGFSTIAPTLAATMVTTNNRFAYAHSFPLSLTPGDWFRIRMTYTASNQTLRTSATRNGLPFGLQPGDYLNPVRLADFSTFRDFRVDAFAISSYSDGQQGGPNPGSVLAHGAVDNVEVIMPEVPMANLQGGFSNALWQVEFGARSNWVFTLERSTNLVTWTNVSAWKPGTNGLVSLRETNAAPGAAAVYRVRGERP